MNRKLKTLWLIFPTPNSPVRVSRTGRNKMCPEASGVRHEPRWRGRPSSYQKRTMAVGVIKIFGLVVSAVLLPVLLSAQILVDIHNNGGFAIPSNQLVILTDSTDDWLVNKSAQLFQRDMLSVTGMKPEVTHQSEPKNKNIILIGTLQSSFIKQLVAEKKLSVDSLRGQWEAFRIATIQNPFNNKGKALVIAGSDKRGAAYGTLELSRQMGVSPWYWWADVPAKKRRKVFVRPGTHFFPTPGVKYRGIFINDEHPSFANWAKEKFGGVHHEVYEKVFELILRLKGNYLWPAMWDNAFNDDDPLNPILADKWGIVMGATHHEPMLRAQKEWKRYGKGPWDYTKNEAELKAFWRKGIENMGSRESIVTVGMRGDGDEPMTEGTAIQLLEKIIHDQREIIADVTGKPASETPQIWALYKEVQDYYDKGMRVPDDVTLLFSDDNWGNLRRLPAANAPERRGGYGIYYHFDYVGGPRNYKWINTNNIVRVWEQMHLAWEYKARQMWIVNVGDLKPMELPISFFLDYAYRPEQWNQGNILDYFSQWADENFGKKFSKEIAAALREYSQLSSRIKPELLTAKTYPYSPANAQNEWDRITDEWRNLETKARSIDQKIPKEYREAYYQLVLHPIEAFGNLHYLYAAHAKNIYWSDLNNPIANQYADSVNYFYEQDSLITIKYHSINDGKWNHMMDQTHIGYTYWQQPPVNKMPEVRYISSTEEENNTVDIIPHKVPGNSLHLIQEKIDYPVFYELNGSVSIEAQHWSKAVSDDQTQWVVIPEIGKTSGGVTTFPVTQSPANGKNELEYEFYTYSKDSIRLMSYFSPTLNFLHQENGLEYEISIDDEPYQRVSLNKEDNTKAWETWVASNNIVKVSRHNLALPGKHILKIRLLSPGIIIQKFILSQEVLSPFYLGQEETRLKLKK